MRRLSIYPHALRDRNAYYSPKKKALLFGYFPVNIKDASNTPGTLVFMFAAHIVEDTLFGPFNQSPEGICGIVVHRAAGILITLMVDR